ncbi:uncharacterized protein E6C27_scaffold230G002000 [Cucumis melo var. makuwa]|uniref:Uncharacterized protein n=1 Tax=Cucumis melo var. makuwa TaxID=1194695 RepID=A0A5A7TYF1_CUCMM|nr:uncharacterized protein E6C27_scaffold230G002000 [Cucumis melo var. makuwa]
MAKMEDVENEQLNALKIVVVYRVDEHIEDDTLCRLDIDPIVVERPVETDDLFLKFDDTFNNAGGSFLMALKPLVLQGDVNTPGT